MPADLEYRAAASPVLDVNEGDHTFALRVVSYGDVVDSYGSRWAPGVFTESLETRMPSACWAHNWENIIGSMVEHDERADGLHGLVKFADFADVPEARKAWSLLRDGHVKDTSFGFKRGNWSDKRNDQQYKPTLAGEKEYIRVARLDEVSPVLVGAVPGAGATAVRADGRITRMDAGQLLLAVASGTMDLRDALNALEGERAAGGKQHEFVAHEEAGDGVHDDECTTCGEAEDSTLHTKRAEPEFEFMDFTLSEQDVRTATALMRMDRLLDDYRAHTPSGVGNEAQLKEYWAHGKGAAKIGWGTDGDFNRCRVEVGKYVPAKELDGFCSNLHVLATGARPGHAPGEKK